MLFSKKKKWPWILLAIVVVVLALLGTAAAMLQDLDDMMEESV